MLANTWKPGIVIILLVYLFASCKREEPLSVCETPTDNHDSTDHYIPSAIFPFDISSEWTGYRPYAGSDTYTTDTTKYYFDGTISSDVYMVYNYDSISSSTVSHEYNVVRFHRIRHHWYLPVENPWNSPGTVTITTGISCYMRQDTLNKRVYIVPIDPTIWGSWQLDTKEYLLYDFSLQPGDTMDYNIWNTGVTNLIIVDTIVPMMISGREYKVLVTGPPNGYNSTSIIIGIGGFCGFLNYHEMLTHYQNRDIDFYP